MFPEAKIMFDYYADNAMQFGTQIINNPKTAPIVVTYAFGIGWADIGGAAGAVSAMLGAVLGGVMIWVTVERWTLDRRIKRQVLLRKKIENQELIKKIRKGPKAQ